MAITPPDPHDLTKDQGARQDRVGAEGVREGETSPETGSSTQTTIEEDQAMRQGAIERSSSFPGMHAILVHQEKPPSIIWDNFSRVVKNFRKFRLLTLS